jgi:predicted phosphoribosyltransferase
MFRDRDDAAFRLAEQLRERPLIDPVVLGIPRGGVVVAAVLAKALPAELDVVLARKLRSPNNPEAALGAVAEDGTLVMNPEAERLVAEYPQYVARERQRQLAELERRKQLFRSVRPAVSLTGRSVIITDDGIATGSTMAAALRAARAQRPRELIVAVPVASPDRLTELQPLCDDIVCLEAPEDFWAVGQFYEDFSPVEDRDVVELLQQATASGPPCTHATGLDPEGRRTSCAPHSA